MQFNRFNSDALTVWVVIKGLIASNHLNFPERLYTRHCVVARDRSRTSGLNIQLRAV